MTEVNPISGLPKIEDAKNSFIKDYQTLEERKVRSDQLRADIDSKTGQVILNKIREQLLVKVNKLIDDDPECKALKRLLVDMGIEINIGEKAIEGLMKLVMKRQAP